MYKVITHYFHLQILVLSDFSHQMLDLLSIGRSDEQRQLYDKIHITLHDARQLDIQHQQPPLKKARTEHSRTIGVNAGKYTFILFPFLSLLRYIVTGR